MAYFKVMLHGICLNVPPDGEVPGIAGFYTTRLVRATTATAAQARARQLVISDWSEGGKYHAPRSSTLQVLIESVSESSFVESLSFANRGYTLYSTNDELDA